MKSEPVIPLKHAELLFVAMSTLVHVLDSRTDYPTENMEIVLDGYRTSRNKYLKQAGFKPDEIKLYTVAATEALIDWLDAQADKKQQTDSHFELWATELENDLGYPDHS